MAQPPGDQLAEFQRAVQLSFDAQPSSARSSAMSSLEQLKQSSDGWSFCMQAFGGCTDDQARFWCLLAVVDMVATPQRYEAIGEQQKQALRGMLLAWLQSKNGPSQTDEPPFIKNKFAQLIVAVIARDYPQQWPQIFPQLLAMLPVRSPLQDARQHAVRGGPTDLTMEATDLALEGGWPARAATPPCSHMLPSSLPRRPRRAERGVLRRHVPAHAERHPRGHCLRRGERLQSGGAPG